MRGTPRTAEMGSTFTSCSSATPRPAKMNAIAYSSPLVIAKNGRRGIFTP